MQAIILAAGMGTRIPQYTQAMPKCMIRINGKPMLAHTVDALREAGITHIIIGLGYKGQVIRDFIAENYPAATRLSFAFVENPVYDTTNNIYSLYLIRDYFSEDDTLLLESDLIYEKEILKELIAVPAANAAVLSPFESWMDGSCCLLDGSGHITGMVGKKDFRYEDASGYYKTVNIWKFSRDFICASYIPSLASYMASYGKNEYYETVLKLVAENDPAALGSLVISGDRWYEVDDIADLSVAEKRFTPRAERYELIRQEAGGSWRFPGLSDFTIDSNPFFPPERLLSELRYGLADCLTKNPSAADELDILAAKLLGADVGQVCVMADECAPAGSGGQLHDDSYTDFASLTGQTEPAEREQLHVVNLGKRYGMPGLRACILFSADPNVLQPYKGKGRLSSPEEYFMQIAGKYKKDYALASKAFTEECARMEKALCTLNGVQGERQFNRLTLRFAARPAEADVKKLAALLLDRYKILVGTAPAGNGVGTLTVFVRDPKSNDRLLAALAAFLSPEPGTAEQEA